MRATLLYNKMTDRFYHLMILALLLLSIYSTSEIPNCGLGCLSCSSENPNECSICDIFHFFIRQPNGSCRATLLPNCEVASLNPSRSVCLLCKPNFIVDFVQGKCLPVHFSKQIDECERYTSLGTCHSCNPGNYIERGLCVNNTEIVENCERYSRNGVCSLCQETYFLAIEENSCLKYPKTKHCKKYNRNRCDECLPGYSKDINFYLRLPASDKTGQTLALSSSVDPVVSADPDNICFPNQVSNCKVFATPSDCAECESQHFLTPDFQCEPYPVNQIKNCLVYSDADNCQVCNELYYQNEGSCVLRESSDQHCSQYDPENDHCFECEDGYILLSNGSDLVCSLRENMIENCAEFQRDQEKCLRCDSDHLFSLNEERCFKQISHCQTHQRNSSHSDYAKCTQCQAPYFLLDNSPQTECTKMKNIPYCKSRTAHKNECEECEHGFFKELPDLCSPHIATLCLKFKSSENGCEKCIAGFEVTNGSCLPIVKVDNCSDLSITPGECNVCHNGYYLSEEKLCLLTNLVGCLEQTLNKNECTTCDEANGFFKDTAEMLCYYREVAHCRTLSKTMHGCEVDGCESGYEVNMFGTCSKVSTNLANCSNSNSGTKCIECDNKKTHFLNPLNNECVLRSNTNCGPNYEFFDEFTDLCVDCYGYSNLVNGYCDFSHKLPTNCSVGTKRFGNTFTECRTCNSGYILTKEKTCVKQDIEGCETYYVNLFGCESCHADYIRNSSSGLCDKIFIPNCLNYHPNQIKCSQCEKSYFLGSDNRCYQYSIEGCETLDPNNKNNCTTCKSGFTGNNPTAPHTSCILDKRPEHCSEVSSGTTCVSCESGYYIDSQINICVRQNIAECISHKPNSNQCMRCKNMYKLDSTPSNTNNICVPASVDNCVETDGLDDICVTCAPNFYLDNSFQCKAISTPSFFDLNIEGCYGNDVQNDEDNCGVCKSGFMKAKLFSLNLLKIAGCVSTEADEDGLMCNLCREYYEFDPVSKGCKPLTSSYTGECIQAYTTKKTMQQVETDKEECLMCRNPRTHFTNSSSNGCTLRTNFVGNCEDYDPHLDECLRCPAGTSSYIPSPIFALNHHVCLEYSPDSSIKNCQVYEMAGIYSASDKACEICAKGYYGENCSSYVEFEDLLFNEKLYIDYSGYDKSLQDSYANVERTVRGIDSSTFKSKNVIGTCKEGYVAALYNFENLPGNYNHFTTFNPVLKRHEMYGTFSGVEECVDLNTIQLVGEGDADFDTAPVVKEGLCGLVVKISGSSKYMCTTCKFGYIAKFKEFTLNTSTYFPVVECTPAAAQHLYKQYTGLGYKTYPYFNMDNTDDSSPVGTLEHILHYDSCSNDLTPVARIDYHTVEKSFYYSENSDPTTSHLAMECVDLHPTHQIENCQVYSTSSLFTDLISGGSAPIINCVACKPGYKLEHLPSTEINTDYYRYAYGLSCAPITNCDLESEQNTAMNMCNKCKEGSTWVYNNINNSISFDECVIPSNQINGQNCKILKNGLSEGCIMCNSGYTLFGSSFCVKLNEPNCEESGLQHIFFDHTSIDTNGFSLGYRLSGLLEAMNLLQMESQSSGKVSQFCNSCHSGNVMTNLNGKVCMASQSFSNVGCYQTKGSTSGCYECLHGYALKDGSCYDWTESSQYYGCQEYDSESNSCKFFAFPYYPLIHPISSEPTIYKVENTSAEFFVAHADTTSIVCNPGFIFNFVTMKCELIGEDDDCNHYYCDPDTSFCVCMECKDPLMTSITYKSPTSNVVNTKVKCFYPSFVSRSIESAHYLVVTTPFSEVAISGLVTQCVSYQFSNPHAMSLILLSTLDKHNYCVPEIRGELNCASYHDYLWECVSCPDLYFLNDLKQCVKGDVPFCTAYNDETQKCSSCDDAHFLDKTQPETSRCSVYTSQCETYSQTADQCLSCPSYLRLAKDSNQNMRCLPYSVDNCLHYSSTNDICLLCREGFYKDPTDSKCKAISLANCSVYNLHSNSCSQCKEGFFMNSDYRCQLVSATNCLTYSNTANACLSCPPFFYLGPDRSCLATMIVGCEIPQVSLNKCSKCAEGFYKDSNQLCIPYTAKHCSIYKPGEDKCFTCDESSFKNDLGECHQYSHAVNCESYHPSKDACVSCIEAFYLDSSNGNGTCLENTSVYCQEYHKQDNKCVNCLTNYFLNAAEKCVPITAQNCLTSMKSQDKCETCSKEFFLQSDSGHCVPYTVFNCRYYNLYKNECVTCKEGYYFDAGMCKTYTAKNCSTFSADSDKCASCRAGYFLDVVSLKCTAYTVNGCSSFNPSSNSCVSCPRDFYQSSSGCSSYTITNCLRRSSSADLCLDCLEGFFFERGHCIPYTVENCAEYHYNKDLCVSCLEGHFFEFGMCYPYTAHNCGTFFSDHDMCKTCDMTLNDGRVYQSDHMCLFHTQVEQCAEYSPNSNDCTSCNHGFYLKDNACHKNPTGIPNCSEYRSTKECIACEDNYYLRDNICHLPTTPLPNCVRYLSENCCSECDPNFSPNKDGLCVRDLERSCLRNADAFNCKTCKPGDALVKNKRNHFVCVPSNLSNCRSAVNTVSGMQCQECESGYFNKNGVCVSPSILVENCQEYNAHGICKKCQREHVLSSDNQSCSPDIGQVGDNCLIGSIQDKPFCSRCEGGFIFNSSGQCVQCAENMTGCAVCDIHNLNYCLICEQGYYMNSARECLEYPIILPPSSVAITSMISIWLFFNALFI